jgi:hypothetical protein
MVRNGNTRKWDLCYNAAHSPIPCPSVSIAESLTSTVTLYFYPENWGSTFPRNVGTYLPTYAVSHSTSNNLHSHRRNNLISHAGNKIGFVARKRSRDSSVGIATGYGLDDSPDRVKNFLFSKSSRPATGYTQPPIRWVPGALSTVIKRPGREAGHSSPTSAEAKETWIHASTPRYAFMA